MGERKENQYLKMTLTDISVNIPVNGMVDLTSVIGHVDKIVAEELASFEVRVGARIRSLHDYLVLSSSDHPSFKSLKPITFAELLDNLRGDANDTNKHSAGD